MKKKAKPTRENPLWSTAELRWYHCEDDFSITHWWIDDRGDGVERSTIDFEHPALRAKGHESRQYRRAPILWEVFRRHPDIPAMCRGFADLLELLAEEEDAFV